MSNLIGCGYTCQRKKNISKLKELYENGLTQYYSAYNEYLQYKYDRSNQRAFRRAHAEKSLRPKVERLNKNLNNILEKLKLNINTTAGVIKTQSDEISQKRSTIERKNHHIKKQDNDIVRTNIDMVSKDRQVNYSKERNSYRRIMMIALIIINILIVAGIVYYFKGSLPIMPTMPTMPAMPAMPGMTASDMGGVL
jgi:hypothetical protein